MNTFCVCTQLDNPSIVRFLGLCRMQYTEQSIHDAFIVQEWCPINLRSLINRSCDEFEKRMGSARQQHVFVYLRQIAEGMMYLHERDIIHHDLKVCHFIIGNLFSMLTLVNKFCFTMLCSLKIYF